MSVLLNTQSDIMKFHPVSAGNRGMRISKTRELANEVNRELTELALKLNELAKIPPFNILYRVKKHDPL